MPRIDKEYAIALLTAMDDELKMKLTRIADRDGKSVEDLVISFLSEGVNTFPGFIASFAKQG